MSIIDKVKKLKNNRVKRTLAVKSAINLTPNMRRVTLGGEELSSFPEGSEGAYIKLLFSQTNNTKPIMRTYTVAEQRSEDNEIDVDFMLHTSDENSENGIAAPWSLNAQIGDTISFFGPGPAKFINKDADYFLLGADMTALPALTANLKYLPKDAQGKVFIEVLSEADKLELTKPEQVEVFWIINAVPGSESTPLYHAIKQAEWQTGRVAAWVACEFNTMKKIRHYLKVEQGIEKTHLYISSYWKQGDTEEQHKVSKQDDAQRSGR